METKKTNPGKQNKKHRAIWRRVLLAVIGIVVGVNIYLANARGIGGNQIPMPFGYGVANVLSGSMEPTFSKGTLLLVKETEDIQVGDIVVYQSGQELIVHRVIELEENSQIIVTQGDANNVADPPFEKSQIRGVVIGWVPFLGNVVSILKTPTGILLILIVAFLLIEMSFRRQRDNDDQELEVIKEEIRRLKAEHESEIQETSLKTENETQDLQNDDVHEENHQDTETESQTQKEEGGR